MYGGKLEVYKLISIFLISRLLRRYFVSKVLMGVILKIKKTQSLYDDTSTSVMYFSWPNLELKSLMDILEK